VLDLVLAKSNKAVEVKNSNETQWNIDVQRIREEERTRIAREIHDELGQWLTALNLEAVLFRKMIPVEDKATHDKLSVMFALINKTTEEVGRIARELRPRILNNLGLVAAIEWHGKEFEKRTGVSQKILSCGHDLDLETNLLTNIFRVYQEALTNIARHAGATRVDTILSQSDNHVSLIIKDDGRGFDLNEARKKSSLGLTGMRERALMLNGELLIEPNKPSGTIVALRVPIVLAVG
jgi:signal transduction histidine kinase